MSRFLLMMGRIVRQAGGRCQAGECPPAPGRSPVPGKKVFHIVETFFPWRGKLRFREAPPASAFGGELRRVGKMVLEGGLEPPLLSGPRNMKIS